MGLFSRVDPIGVLCRLFERGCIDKGTRGELVARLLLILTYDRALREVYAREGHITVENHSRAVPVRDFLKALIAEDYVEQVMKCKAGSSDNQHRSLGDAFEGAYVRFSHFARNGVHNVVDTFTGLAAIARGMAIQCCQNQDSIDIAIPVVLKDEKLREDIMSMILIQVKDSDRKVSPGEITAEKLNVFPDHTGPDGDADRRPYIVIDMQLGVIADLTKKAERNRS